MITDKEITEVERHLYKTRSKGEAGDWGENTYAESLKELMSYLRCSIRPCRSNSPNFPFLEKILNNIEKRDSFKRMLLKSK